MPTLCLTDLEQRAILTHAKREAPREACGILLTHPDGRRELVEGWNAQVVLHRDDPIRYPEPATVAFVLDPMTTGEIIRRRKAGWKLAVIWHSHSNGVDRLSTRDVMASCNEVGEPHYQNTDQVIAVLLMDGRPARLVGFRWDTSRRAYRPVEITTTESRILDLTAHDSLI